MNTLRSKILAVLAVTTVLISGAKAQVVVNYGSLLNDVAQDYLGGGVFQKGPDPLALGNINTTPTRQAGAVKFDISQFGGQTISNAALNLFVEYYVDYGSFFPTQTIDVYRFNYDLSSAAFVASDLSTTDITYMGSFTLSTNVGDYQYDVSAAVQDAVDAGFDYVGFKFVNITVENDPVRGEPAFVGFSTTPSHLSMTVTAIPEPSTYALLGLAGIVIAFRMKNHHLPRTGYLS